MPDEQTALNPLPSRAEIRDALHWWQVQEPGSEGCQAAAVRMAELLRQVLRYDRPVLCEICRLQTEARARAYISPEADNG